MSEQYDSCPIIECIASSFRLIFEEIKAVTTGDINLKFSIIFETFGRLEIENLFDYNY